MVRSFEYDYLALIRTILHTGVQRGDRTGTGTRAIHGASLRCDLRDGKIPLLTTKRVAWRAVVAELLWFLDGGTNIRPLLENNCRIWSDWPYAAYKKANPETDMDMAAFEQAVLDDPDFAMQWGDLGPVYGKQWRQWEAPDGTIIDQVSEAVDLIRKNPESRRILWHAWNPADLDRMALPPCHLLYQFFVADGELSLTLYQRSVDVGLGLPFNLASAGLLVHLMAQQTGLKPGELFWVGHDVHIYNNHLDPLAGQLERSVGTQPTVQIREGVESLFDYGMDDISLVGYRPMPNIPMDVAV